MRILKPDGGRRPFTSTPFEALSFVRELGEVRKRVLALLAAAACVAVPFTLSWTQTRGQQGEPMATKERILAAGWWPTKSSPPRDEYLGPAACAGCHHSEAAQQETTPMAKACAVAANSKTLQTHSSMTFSLREYHYEIKRDDSRSIFSVSDGTRTISTPLGWAFGEGETGETYVFERAGVFYEGKLSYFPGIQALDITPGQPVSVPADLEGAVGRPMEADEAPLCFGCHNTASSAGGQFAPEHLIPGVTCEACHGPGAKHAAAMKAGKIGEGLTRVLNPARLHPVESVDFCGACHRAWADVMESGMEGIATVRFQPYRLELSRCWGKGDARITCLACHDPHQPLAHNLGSYDSCCLKCHVAKGEKAAAGHPGAACPESTKGCATCHMPKFEVPGTHAKFTDHQIRIVRMER
ncbi:MAG: multiheme c-type cytochrome [Terriglobia bacterium]